VLLIELADGDPLVEMFEKLEVVDERFFEEFMA
jgi:hypothetical protein